MRPPGFKYAKGGELYCEGVPLGALAEKYGTPLYVYSAATVHRRYRDLDRAFRAVPHTICYSVKANSNLSLLRMLARLGAGFDVVSGGELERVRRVSRRALTNVVFSGVGKTADEIDLGLRAGILMFNVESAGELALLAGRASRLKKNARVAIRVNPDVVADTHPHISTGQREHKFGVSFEEARELYSRAAQERRLEPAGVSVHIGSQITDVTPFTAAMKRVAAFVRQLTTDAHHIRYVDAGGGLGIPYKDDYVAGFPEYARAVLNPLRGLNVHLLLEPGRAIVGSAGSLVTRVLYRKKNGGRQFLVVDAAMNDLLRPSLYNAYHEIVPVADVGRRSTATFDVVGPVCETGDFLARDRRLPACEPGDLLAVLDAGAYGLSLASNYNSRPLPAEVLVDGSSATLIRRRESISDLMRLESQQSGRRLASES